MLPKTPYSLLPEGSQMTKESKHILLINNLEALNRKERYYLLLEIIRENAFKPSKRFIKSLRNKLVEPAITRSNLQFAAMDYHLDWIYAALYATTENIDLKVKQENTNVAVKNNGLVSGAQQDIDFIMAFSDEQSDVTHLILIEAKGVGRWNTKQLTDKGVRLKALFETYQLHKKVNVVPHFLYVSPSAPSKNQLKSDLPDLMIDPAKHHQMKLPTPLVKVTRCMENGEQNKKGNFWKFELERTS
jgi:hypothetical protein